MKKIYILQMQTYTRISRMISYFNGYLYSHVAISLEKDCHKLYSFGRINPHRFYPGGFSIETRDGEFYRLYDKTICRIQELAVSDRQYDLLKKYLDNMTRNRQEYVYDYYGIVLRFFRIPVSFRNRYVCSQFCAEALDRAEIWSPGKEYKWVRPQDFDNIQGARKIYEGEYQQY